MNPYDCKRLRVGRAVATPRAQAPRVTGDGARTILAHGPRRAPRAGARALAALVPPSLPRALGALAAAGLALAALGIAGAARADDVAVTLDRALVMKVRPGTQTVIIGNPIIADVAVQRNGVMVLTGKTYGVTNMIALDATGATINESVIRVGPASDNVVTVQRGMDRETHHCAPRCAPALQLGDSQAFFSGVGGQATARNGLATAPAAK